MALQLQGPAFLDTELEQFVTRCMEGLSHQVRGDSEPFQAVWSHPTTRTESERCWRANAIASTHSKSHCTSAATVRSATASASSCSPSGVLYA